MHKTITFAICSLSLAARLWAADENADNTDKNKRDRTGQTITAGDQSNSRDDIDLAAAIRRAVVKDDKLSMMAKNVKIITNSGEVTLRGPVKSEAEKKEIGELAKTGGAK